MPEFQTREERALGGLLDKRKILYDYTPMAIHPALGIHAPFILRDEQTIIGFVEDATPYDQAIAGGYGYELILLNKGQSIEEQL